MKWTKASKAAVTVLFLALAASLTAGQTVPKNYFGLHASTGVLWNEGWPQVPFGAIRFLSTSTTWAQMNTSPGVYDWSMLDRWMNATQSHGLQADDLVYTFAAFPRWASSNPYDLTCAQGPGSCDPPNDLRPDGTGTDQTFKNFATALATHVAGRIRYWEVWNEPYWAPYFTGTPAQIVRMTQDLRAIVKGIDPNAKLLSPSGSDMHVKLSGYCWAANTIDQYFAAGIGPYVDVINFHAYFTPTDAPDQPENFLSEVQCIRTMMANRGQQGKPLWASEGGWGHNTDLPNADTQAAFVARAYLLLWSAGVQRFYWYRYDNSDVGTLYNGGLLAPGTAYSQVADWMVGATQTQPCEPQGSLWTCGYTLANGSPAQAVWSNTLQKYTVPSSFAQYRTIWGTTYSVRSDRTVWVYQKPKLLF